MPVQLVVQSFWPTLKGASYNAGLQVLKSAQETFTRLSNIKIAHRISGRVDRESISSPKEIHLLEGEVSAWVAKAQYRLDDLWMAFDCDANAIREDLFLHIVSSRAGFSGHFHDDRPDEVFDKTLASGRKAWESIVRFMGVIAERAEITSTWLAGRRVFSGDPFMLFREHYLWKEVEREVCREAASAQFSEMMKMLRREVPRSLFVDALSQAGVPYQESKSGNVIARFSKSWEEYYCDVPKLLASISSRVKSALKAKRIVLKR